MLLYKKLLLMTFGTTLVILYYHLQFALLNGSLLHVVLSQ